MVRSLVLLLSSLLCADAFLSEVRLVSPRYVLAGESAVLECQYSVGDELLRKVEFLRDSSKIFQYVKGRQPPYRNFSLPGAQLDMAASNKRFIILKNMSFDATGVYSCEVSTAAPIYTKPSSDEELTVIQPQKEAPTISVRKDQYQAGEVLEANCTSSPARPVPYITWLVNDKMIDDQMLRLFPEQRQAARDPLSSSTVQLSVSLPEDMAGLPAQLQLRCLSTIPAFLGHDQEYADVKSATVTVPVRRPRVGSCAASCWPLAQAWWWWSPLAVAARGLRHP
ncbi:uncharacterized protein LOC134533511 [Bacillus rossius redtenbacheri]|uniref:uncharacterized protein LOC134533511 n=1 Tax=Bacillus rossius redtenbacheri TaxID=93214 RepID=UPI002FDE75E3